MTTFRVKRIYDEPTAEDGVRVLADRLWPRGLKKQDAQIELWPKDVTPSTALRTWYHEHPEEFGEFERRYLEELDDHPEALDELRDAGEVVTLLTARKEIEGSHLDVLLAVLEA